MESRKLPNYKINLNASPNSFFVHRFSPTSPSFTKLDDPLSEARAQGYEVEFSTDEESKSDITTSADEDYEVVNKTPSLK